MKHPKIMFSAGLLLGTIGAISLSANADRLSRFNDLAEQKGAQWGVNPNLIRAIVSVESAGRLDAVSNKGATGVMQLMPATAERMGIPRSQLFDPERNMEAGVRYLSFLNKRYNGNPTLIAAGYNAGEGAVDKYGGVPPYRETQNYAPAVVARMKLLDQCGQACYTHAHMANPYRYMNNYSQAYAQPTQAIQTNATDVFSNWLGKPVQKQTPQPQTQLAVRKQVNVVSVAQTQAQKPIQQTPKPVHIPKRAGFVMTENNGTFETVYPIS